jgi:hypothetical protein
MGGFQSCRINFVAGEATKSSFASANSGIGGFPDALFLQQP